MQKIDGRLCVILKVNTVCPANLLVDKRDEMKVSGGSEVYVVPTSHVVFSN